MDTLTSKQSIAERVEVVKGQEGKVLGNVACGDLHFT